MNREISSRILGSKGLNEKEIKNYYKRLKNLRQAIAKGKLCGNIVERFFELEGGFRFFYQEWLHEQIALSLPPKKIVLVFHGAYGCSDLFYPLADVLTNQGALVVGIDYRGHGRTAGYAGGQLGDIERFSQIFEDIEHLLYHYKKLYDIPIFLLGYDLGGLIAMNIAERNPKSNIEGLVLISPLLKLKKQFKHLLLYPFISMGRMVVKHDPVQRVLKEELYPTYYEEYRQFATDDPFRLKKMSLRMFQKILDLIYSSTRIISKLSYPCFIFQGTADNIVDHIAIEKYFHKWPHPQKKIRLYQKGGHNLLMDKYTSEIYEEIIKFLGLRDE
ncbi:MAG: hypothetical protein DRO88_06140 [Promethearchaeia archaeon]|nr:MAG: hypothetical protein DRO88_06140 [Candidatus Lokiarchaeia archaeon]